MKIEQLAPVAMIILSAVAFAVYAYKGDARHALYWLGSVIIISSVTF